MAVHLWEHHGTENFVGLGLYKNEKAISMHAEPGIVQRKDARSLCSGEELLPMGAAPFTSQKECSKNPGAVPCRKPSDVSH